MQHLKPFKVNRRKAPRDTTSTASLKTNMTLASLVQQMFGIREMAGILNRSPSTISRELRRNTGTAGYASAQAREQSTQRCQAARPDIKLHTDALLFDEACNFLQLLWSPKQIALTLAHIFPIGNEHLVSHETIYNCIYAQPVGGLRKELIWLALRNITEDWGRAFNKIHPQEPISGTASHTEIQILLEI